MQLHNMSEGTRRRYETTADDLDAIVNANDLSALSAEQRRRYYLDFCREHGLNPRLKPFMWLWTKDRRLILYCPKTGSDQLRKVHGVSINDIQTSTTDGCYVVKVMAGTPDGRSDFDIGTVNLHNLKGNDRSNAIMTAVTKAKRRVTISICGVGLLDELEVATMDDVSAAEMDLETGELTPAELAEVLRTGVEPKLTSDQLVCFRAIVRDMEWHEEEWRALLVRHGYEEPNQIGRFREFDVIKEQLSDITVRNAIRDELAGGEVSE
jgi:hypothetical protein